MGRSQCSLWTPPKRKVPPRSHRRILTLCCCRHPGLHLNNISHTPPRQDIHRISCLGGQRPTIQQSRIQNLCLHHWIQTQENNAPMAPGQRGNRMLHAHCKKKSIKIVLNKGGSWKQKLFKFLLNYRTIPHCTTGAPPATIWPGHKKPPATPDPTHC